MVKSRIIFILSNTTMYSFNNQNLGDLKMNQSVYTETVVSNMVARYKDVVAKDYDTRSAVVAELADELKQTVGSVRSKLVREGVYVAKETTKASGATKSKEDIVKALEAISGETLTSFNKATKKDLEAFWSYLVKANDKFDVDNV